MTIDELRALNTRCTRADVLTLPADAIGTGPAAALIGTWLDGTLTVTGLRREDHDATVVVHGTVTVSGLGITEVPVTGIEFGVDPVDHEPTLYVPLVLPADWDFATSFPETGGSDLAGLAFPAPPALLLTSAARPARQAYPALDAGVTFHAAEVADPAPLGTLVTLLRPGPGELSLTGPIARRPATGPGDTVRTEITLRSAGRPEEAFSASFHLWAGSRGGGAEGPTVVYGLRLAADLFLGQDAGATVSAPADSGGGTVVLTADRLPGRLATGDLAAWNGTGAAVHRLVDQEGFALGDAVRLTGVSAAIDPAKLGQGGLAAALTQVTATVETTPGTVWPIAGDDLALTGVGATLTVTDPLRASRTAHVTGHGDFTVTGDITLHATAEIPPGTFQLTLDESTPVRLTDVLRHFLPHADLTGAPDLTLTAFSGTATPKQGACEVDATVSSDWHLDIGAARVCLTEAGLTVTRHGDGAARPEAPTAPGGSPSRTTGTLSATAEVGPAQGGDGSAVRFSATWDIPGAFQLTGAFPDLDLTALLASLACRADVPLPDGLPQVSLLRPAVTVRLGDALAGQPARGRSYELAVATTARFDGTELAFVGKAGRTPEGATLFAAVLSQGDWSWSPGKVSSWAPALAFLDGITFTRSGLAVSSADDVPVDGGQDAPDTLPATLDKGLTFFTELGLTGPLAPLGALFQDTTGIHLTARLTTPVQNSEFTASIAEQKTRAGFGGLILTIRPAAREVSLQTSWNFTVPGVGTAPATLLQFVAGGALKGAGFHLFLVLKPAGSAAESVAGRPVTRQLAYALRSSGPTPLPGPPDPAPPAVRRTAARLAGLTAAPSAKDRPAWKNAFGVEGFDIHDFFMEIGSGEAGPTLGAGGSVVIGEATLELDIEGGFEPEPFVTVFRFALGTVHQGTGISLWDMLAVLVTAPDWLGFLRQIVLHELAIRVVTVPGGWTDPATHEEWPQGFYAKGDIDFFGNNWRFEVNIGDEGLYASSAIAQPLKLAGVLTFSDATGTKGPRYLLDTRGIRGGHLPAKIFLLSGRLDLLGVSATVEAHLGDDGFAFALGVDVLEILRGEMSCVLGSGGLRAKARIELDLDVTVARGVVLGGIPVPAGNLVGVHLVGGFDLVVDGTGVDLALTAGCDAYLLDVHLVHFAFDQHFPIARWADIAGYLKDDPEKLFASLGEGIWDAIKDCATTTAAQLT
ncbi:hypothetical protein [Streptantibioticus cattleyicolor]|uniref:Uncharacterized protein n=1 Tax=Streptantibioticus cattleyicolor (strain ATCC 35852 / DSM 46488 / JCM 4925 / NBRC 14057 / NRRL 8057) TaxID=1003195 RepID=F8JL18_STREN|nr:hypothetical protein [Streptantibioticus cattleyicolor]AEW98402.1 hypothetical protein SCATT_p02090 [Streptantibioticus cattleyicolor NRRL 8057 = DSM 46488]CCB72538.1 protein of unknown function [Streptantibioticus cattleyicolor NRRL 8057 = DSM 46488]